MSIIARQSTTRTVMVGPVLDASGVAVTDGVVADVKISKNGGAPAALNGSATLTHRHTGHYSLALTTSDLDTVGQAELCMDDTVNAMPVKVITVVEEAVYDALFVASATGMLPSNVIQISGDSTAADNLEAAADGSGYNLGGGSVVAASVTGAVGSVAGSVGGSVVGDVGGDITGNVNGSVASIASGGITAASFAADAITAAKIAADVTTELQAGLATAASITALDGKIDTIDSNVDAILVDTAEIGAAGAGLTNINLPNQTMDIVGNITGNLSGSVGSVTGAVGSVTGAVGSVTGLTASDVGAIKAETDKLADTLEDDAGTYRFTTNALEQAPTGGGAADGSGFTAIPWNASWDAEVQSEVTDALNAYDPPTKAELDSAVAPLATAAALTIVDDFLDTEVAAIKAKTDNLPSDPADQSAVEAAITAAQLTAAGVRSAVGLASANLDTQLDALPTNAELTTALGTADDAVLAAIAALNNLSAAQVASALNTYDAPTKAEFDAAVALLATAANLALVPAAVLTAAAANPIDANVQEINDTALTGDGNSTPWGPAA
jgi:hypothetical protein